MFIFNRKETQKKTILIAIVIIAVGVGILYNLKVDYKFHINDNKTVTLDKYIGNGIKVNIPNKIMGLKVTEIGVECFYKNEKIEEVYIPKNIEIISSSAFERCKNMKKISGGESVNEIRYSAFCGDVSLEDVFPLAKVKVLHDYAFTCCERLRNIILSEDVIYIGSCVFSKTCIKPDIVPENTTYVSGRAFIFNDDEDSMLVVGDHVLVQYPNEEVVTIPKGIKVISECWVKNENITKKFIIPNTVVYVSNSILRGTDQAVIYIPESVKEIGDMDNAQYKEEKLDDVSKICGIKGSYAEDYAKRYNIPFEEVERWY